MRKLVISFLVVLFCITMCKSVPASGLSMVPSHLYRSHYLFLPTFAAIAINELVLVLDDSSTLSISPEGSVIPLITYVILSNNQIWTLLLVMPEWYDASDAIEITISNKTDSGTGAIPVYLLPF